MMEIKLRMMDALIVKLIQDISVKIDFYKNPFVTNVKKIVINVVILTLKLIVNSVIMDTIYKIILVCNATHIAYNVYHNNFVLNARLLILPLIKKEYVLNVRRVNNFQMDYANLFAEMAYQEKVRSVILDNKMIQEGKKILFPIRCSIECKV